MATNIDKNEARMRITHIMYDTTITEFVDKMLHIARTINATVEWIKNCAKQIIALNR